MMVGDGGKKGNGDNENSEQIDGELVPSSDKLREIPDELEMEASDKVLEIDQKHNETRKPVYLERNAIVGLIPDFWLTTFLSHPVLSERLTEEDRKILEYLGTLDVEESKDVKSGYSITFNFRPNPFFEDSKLTKTFTFLEEGTIITATSIKWKEGMGLPNGAACEKKENKGPLFGESFFHWFSDAQHKDVTAQIHDEIADIIKEEWAKPLVGFRELHAANCQNPLVRQPVCPTSYNQVSEEETVAAYTYKMDRPLQRPDQVRVEIRQGRALWVIGEGDKPLKVKLPSLNKMRVSEATASMNADHVLTIVIPKSREPSKWHEYKHLVFAWFKTIHVAVSTT